MCDSARAPNDIAEQSRMKSAQAEQCITSIDGGMHDNIDTLQYLRCLAESSGIELRAVGTDEEHRCIELKPALRCTRESRAEIAFPLGADLNAVWDRYVMPSRIANRRRYPQFHRTDSCIKRMYQRHGEHALCKGGGTLRTESWDEPCLSQPGLRSLGKYDDPGRTHSYTCASTLAGTPRQYAQRNRHIKIIVRHTPQLSQRRPEVTTRARRHAGGERARSRLHSSISSING